MNDVTATLLGMGICCVVPLLAFVAGVFYAKHGLPITVQWRGLRRETDDEEPGE